MPLDKDLDNNRSVKVDRSTIVAMCECNNHKHSFHFNVVTKQLIKSKFIRYNFKALDMQPYFTILYLI